MRDVVRGWGYYVRRIILGEEECEARDRVGEVDRSGGVCYGKCDERDRGLVLHITLLCACVSSNLAWGYGNEKERRIESSEKSSQKRWDVFWIICIKIRLSA